MTKEMLFVSQHVQFIMLPARLHSSMPTAERSGSVVSKQDFKKKGPPVFFHTRTTHIHI